VALSGCVRDIEIENQEARVTSIGPIDLDTAGNVIINYTLQDPEGDDQDVQVQICTAADQNCGTAVEGRGGDPTTRVPTIPAGTDVPHEFRWAPWCGRWEGTEQTDSDPDTEYVAGIFVLGTSTTPLYSEPFTLADLGATDGDCAE
jgi:hypothetical protein